MTTEQTVLTLADKLRVNIERERIESAERQRKAAEEADRRRIADFAFNLANLKKDFLRMADAGKVELEMPIGEEHVLFDEVQDFEVRYGTGTPQIAQVIAPMKPSLSPAWVDFAFWVREQGLVINFTRETSHRSDEENYYVMRLDLQQD